MSHLCEECEDPDANKHNVSTESVEDVPLTMDLTSIDLIEKSHHDERVKDDSEVLIGSRTQCLSTAVHVKQLLTCTSRVVVVVVVVAPDTTTLTF